MESSFSSENIETQGNTTVFLSAERKDCQLRVLYLVKISLRNEV